MKKVLSKVVIITLTLIISVTYTGMVLYVSAENYVQISVQLCNIKEEQIDEHIKNLNDLNLQLACLNDVSPYSLESPKFYNERKTAILNEIENEKEQLLLLDVDTPDKDLDKMAAIIQSSSKDDDVYSPQNSSGAETFKNQISQLNQRYDVYGSSGLYSDGTKNYSYYRIRVVYNKNKENTTFPQVELAKSDTIVLYDKISANSQTAKYWVEEIVKIYAGKVISTVADMTLAQFLPYELLFSSKPSPTTISSTGDATVVTLSTICAMKYTYIYNEAKDSWVHLVTSNMVTSKYTETQALFINGTIKQDSYTSPSIYTYGGYNTDVQDAVSRFKNGFITPVYQNCIQKFSCYGKYSGRLDTTIKCPLYLSSL